MNDQFFFKKNKLTTFWIFTILASYIDSLAMVKVSASEASK